MRPILWVLTPLLVLGTVRAAAAQQATPTRSYTALTADGRHVFVMLVPEGTRRYDPEKDEVRKQYPQSGLYPVDRNDRPLWTVDWYAYPVWPANDGVHLVRGLPPTNAKTPDALAAAEAFGFYASGRPV